MKDSNLLYIISALIIMLFIYTAVSKIIDYTLFKEQLSESYLLKPISSTASWLIPLSEFVAAILLLMPSWRLNGLYLSFGILTTFLIYILTTYNNSNEQIQCGCGGFLEHLSFKDHVIFNASFIILTYTGIRIERRNKIRN